MQFLFPSFLWALLALAIPIIIHLFFFRRFKKVYFTNVRFLKEVKEETSARQRLKNLLTLLMRLLALAFLVLAFAQPFIPRDVAVKKGEKAVSVFIDNSNSMSSKSEDVPLFEKAKTRAKEIINAYSVEDRFQILTNDFEGRHQRLVSKEDALSLVDEVKLGFSVKELSKVMARQKQALNTGTAENKISYVISDFQKNITDVQNYADTTSEINFVPLQSVQVKNISIDSAWFDAPVQMMNQTNRMLVKVKNHSKEQADNIRLSLRHAGQVKPVGVLSIPGSASVVDTVNITILKTGWHEAELNITDHPIEFDDNYYFTFNVAEQVNVLVINESAQNKYLNAAFGGVDFFKVDNQLSRALNYSDFPNYQLIIVNELSAITSGLTSELKQYAEAGGNVLFFPAANGNESTYKGFFQNMRINDFTTFDREKRVVSTINTEEFIFQDVYDNKAANLRLPVTEANYKVNAYGSRGEERLMVYRDGGSFISKYKRGQGHLYVCTAPLNEKYNNLVRSGEVFIPMLYKMSISTSKNQKISYTIGSDDLIEADSKVDGNELVYKLRGEAEEFIPEQRIVGPKVILGLNNEIGSAGYYNLFLNEEEPLAEYAFNYDRKESAIEYYNETDLQDKVGQNVKIISSAAMADLTPYIGERSQGRVLWRWCLIAALIFLGLEVLVLRLFKS